LVLAEGAGSEMRRTLGTAVFGGMLGVTLFGIFLTPVFYYVIQWFNDLWTRRKGRSHRAEPPKPKPPGPLKRLLKAMPNMRGRRVAVDGASPRPGNGVPVPHGVETI